MSNNNFQKLNALAVITKAPTAANKATPAADNSNPFSIIQDKYLLSNKSNLQRDKKLLQTK
jgi:hypothetical protein